MPLTDIQKIYPDGYDDNSTVMGKPANREVFTLKSGIDVSSTTITVNGNATGIDTPCLLLFAGGEIWYVENGDIGSYDSGNDQTNISVTYEQRAQLGTKSQIHTTDEEVFTYFSGKQNTVIRNILISLEKFPFVKDQQRSAAVVGEAYVTESGMDIYVSFDGANYVLLSSANHTNLSEFSGGGDTGATKVHGDQYLNDDNLSSWHSAIAGSHIAGGDDHTHLVDASPVRRIVSGSSLPSVEKMGQVYLLDGTLYISFDGSSWSEFFGIPQGSISAFPPAGGCPAGWSEYTALNESYAKTEQGGTGTKSGSNTHSHQITNIPEHYHTILSDTASTSNPGDHNHGITSSGSGPTVGLLMRGDIGSTTNTSDNTHSHSGSIEASSTSGLISGSLVSSITSGSESSEPLHITAVWCKKD